MNMIMLAKKGNLNSRTRDSIILTGISNYRGFYYLNTGHPDIKMIITVNLQKSLYVFHL